MRKCVAGRLASQKNILKRSSLERRKMIYISNLDLHKEIKRIREGINEGKIKTIFLYLIKQQFIQNIIATMYPTMYAYVEVK